MYTGRFGVEISTNAVPDERPTSAYSRPVIGSVHPQMSLPLPPPISSCGRNAIKSMLRHGYGPAIPSSEQMKSVCASSLCNGRASAFNEQPHEQPRPLASSGHALPLHAQWDPRGGSENGMPAARTRRMPAGECSAATRTMATTAISATPAAMRLTGLLYEVSHLVSTQQLHRARHAELIKRLQIIERRLRFPHLPAEHTRFDAILGEVDDREAVLLERIESGIELNARRRTRRRTPP